VREYTRAGRSASDPGITKTLVAFVRALIEGGYGDEGIMEQLELSDSELSEYKRKLFAQELLTVNHRPPDEIFIEYRMRMEGVVMELDLITKGAKDTRQFQAAMGAQKAKAAIIDKVIDRGQEMGIIPRAAKRHEVIGGIVVATLSDPELLAHIGQTVKATRLLLKEYGDTNFIDIDLKAE
jgi:hypothetical protein